MHDAMARGQGNSLIYIKKSGKEKCGYDNKHFLAQQDIGNQNLNGCELCSNRLNIKAILSLD